MLVLCLVFGSGCSLLSGKNADQADADKDSDEVEVKQAATDVEGMLREGPGKYAGDKYDEEKVKAELDKLPPLDGRMQRPTDDDDRPLAVRRYEHDVARVRLHADGGVDGRARVRDFAVNVQRRVVDANRREQMQLGVRLRQLVEGDPATSPAEHNRLVDMEDLARSRQRRHIPFFTSGVGKFP